MMDLSNSFDNTNHFLLIAKRQTYGFDKPSLQPTEAALQRCSYKKVF